MELPHAERLASERGALEEISVVGRARFLPLIIFFCQKIGHFARCVIGR